MPLPQHLKLSEDDDARLRSYLRDELVRHDAERRTWVDDLSYYHTVYRAKPDLTVPDGQVKNLSRIIVPLVAISVEALHARNMTTMFSLSQLTSVRLSPEWTDIEDSVGEVLDHQLLKVAKFRQTINDATFEATLFGAGVARSSWHEVKRKAIRYNGDVEETYWTVTRRGIDTDAIPLANFLMPFGSNDPQTAPWCGEEQIITPFEFKRRIESGYYDQSIDFDDVSSIWRKLETYFQQGRNSQTSGQAFSQAREREDNRTPIWPKEFKVYHLWLDFDIDDDGVDESIIVDYHLEADLILSVRANWNDDFRRQYRYTNHFRLPHRWTGIGVGHMADQPQIEATTIHRQRLDNAALANMRMLKVKRLSGISRNEPIFNGKIWMVDDMADIEPFQFGEVYNSAYQNEQAVMILHQQRTGVNDLTLGMDHVGTPGTAADVLARVQEGKRKFDFSYAHHREFAADLATDCFASLVQFGVSNVKIFQRVPYADKVRQFFTTVTPQELRDFIIADVSIAGQNQNKMLDRANWTQLNQTLTQYFTALQAGAQALGDPKLLQHIAKASMLAADEAMRQILESYDWRNIDRMLANIKNVIGQNQQQPSPDGNPFGSGSTDLARIAAQFQLSGVNPIAETTGGTGL